MRCLVSMASFYLSAGDPWDSRQIWAAVELFKARLRQQRAHRSVLSHAVLKKQPASGRQVAGGVPDYFPDCIQAVRTRYQRAARLESEVREMHVSFGDIGRIGQDEIKTLARQRLEPASMPEFDLESGFDRSVLRDVELVWIQHSSD